MSEQEMKRHAVLLLIVSILLITGCGQKANSEDMVRTYTQIDQETAKEMMARDDGHIIVDVRRQDEFYFAPDTPQETYHIEFRYGSDQSKLGSYDSDSYAYWLPSGISADYNQKMIEDCIQLFCAENLAG